MLTSFGQFARALVSNAALADLYAARRDGKPADGVRSRASVALVATLIAGTIIILGAAAWVPTNVSEYVSSRSRIYQIAETGFDLRASALTACATAGCDLALTGDAPAKTSYAALDALANPHATPGRLHVRYELPPAAWANLQQETRFFVVSLPGLGYYRARLFVNGEARAELIGGARLVAHVETERVGTRPLVIDVVAEVEASQRSLSATGSGDGLIIAAGGEFERYLVFVAGQKGASPTAGRVGMVAKIAVALLCLLLFLLIDSSPESLGLALFLGLEAAAVGIREGWLPVGVLFGGRDTVIVNYLNFLGAVMRLYFLMQLARFARKGVAPWLIGGSVLALAYGFFVEYAQNTGVQWLYIIPRTRDTVVGGLGALVCFRSALFLRGQGLPFRVTALGIAGVGALFEIHNTWLVYSVLYAQTPLLQTLHSVLQANTRYLFALSAFINISTLENRVRALGEAQARSREVERELEIGRMVQRSLLTPPLLPPGVGLACYHEAAVYVSGDTYYVHWDEASGVFTVLLNDVVGHGVQAALKASACSVLAKAIWARDLAAPGGRFAEYDRMTNAFLSDTDEGTFNCLIGAELEPRTGELTLYRANFTFPILIAPCALLGHDMDPVLGELWQVRVLAIGNQEVQKHQLARGSFVLMLSDGFLTNSRILRKLVLHLRQRLAGADHGLDVQTLGKIILGFDEFRNVSGPVDDRTFLVFQYALDAARQHTVETQFQDPAAEVRLRLV